MPFTSNLTEICSSESNGQKKSALVQLGAEQAPPQPMQTYGHMDFQHILALFFKTKQNKTIKPTFYSNTIGSFPKFSLVKGIFRYVHVRSKKRQPQFFSSSRRIEIIGLVMWRRHKQTEWRLPDPNIANLSNLEENDHQLSRLWPTPADIRRNNTIKTTSRRNNTIIIMSKRCHDVVLTLLTF